MKRVLTLWFITMNLYAQSCHEHTLGNENHYECDSVCEGIVIKQIKTQLFDSFQAIYIAEIDTAYNEFEFGIWAPDSLLPTSIIAESLNATIAINGTFFNMKEGGSRHFIKVNRAVIFSTEEKEFKTRASGVVTATCESIDISFWDMETERNYDGKSEDALVSGPLMIDNNKDVCMWDNDFVNNRHPRSFIGVTKNGKVLFVVVDGRQPGYAEGMSLFELRWLARRLGCSDALNLDGGGSSTLYVNDQGVINKPSDPVERAVASILYVKMSR